MIWQFDNTQVYILGSLHFMKEGSINRERHIDAIYNNVQKVVFETSLDPQEASICSYESDKLSNNISKSLFRDTKKVWQKYGIEYSKLEKSKIWFAAMLIGNSINESNGFLFNSGIDKRMWDKSKRDNKEIEWLESKNDLLFYFENAPQDEQQKFLKQPVRNKTEFLKRMNQLTEVWNDRDEEGFIEIQNKAIEELPELFKNLIFQRNSNWINKFITTINSETPTLFVIGALHCVGEKSVQNMLLNDYGYTSKVIAP
ncbi:TraB/GumN family protein [uncultured Paraglaciecola sp.]|uniref:TraB/GumN family protein n=1 Tax=uncultured Paraglaciecola sp. TaxID=1765024 RepID=UPI0030DC66E5|tara:strand:+ start:28881 stop:29651 length:771 start_codon:yes stop_codon:yes gene_type:complete